MQNSFKMHPLEPLTFKIFFLFYFISFIFYVIYSINKKDSIGKAGTILLGIGLLFNTINLILRGIEAGRVPFSNFYESLIIFIWGIAACLLWAVAAWRLYIAGVAVMPIILVTSAYSLTTNRNIEPLMPALQSNWMAYHVATAIIAYGAFANSFGLALLYLFRENLEKKNSKSRLLEKIPDLKKLDLLIYKVIAFGFPFLVLLVITGAVWAEIAWGSYWQWDPKETWSLITVFIYAGFLHARLFLKWRGRTCALFAVIGFISVIICYLGVNLFLSGLHSYGGK